MDIKTFMAAAVVALTAACSQEAPEALTEINATEAANNPADRDHSAAREANVPAQAAPEPGPHAPVSK